MFHLSGSTFTALLLWAMVLQCLTDAPDGDCLALLVMRGDSDSVGVSQVRWLCGEGGVQGTTAVVRPPKALVARGAIYGGCFGEVLSLT